MNVFVSGATGYIGRQVVAALLREGHHLTLSLRDVERGQLLFPDCRVIKGDFSIDHSAEDWRPRLKNIDIVINAVGIISQKRHQRFDALHMKAPIALFTAAQEMGVKRVIQISALGADENAASAYHLSKRAADRALQEMNIPSTILRPSIVYGPDAASWSLFRGLAALPLIGLIDGGGQKIQPIHIDDLVKAVVIAAQNKSGDQQVIDAAGAEAISFKNLLSKMRHQTNSDDAIFLSIPSRMATLAGKFASVTGSRMMNADTVKMLLRGNCADITPFVRKFGFTPSALAFEPLSKAEKLHARTYFVPTLLRISIAFVWLMTAFVSAFIYPVADSLALLAKLGLTGSLAYVALYSAAFLDFVLGVAVLTRFKPRLVTLVQLMLIAVYTFLLTLFIPELWFHPFGPLTKNIPLVAAILTLYAMDEKS